MGAHQARGSCGHKAQPALVVEQQPALLTTRSCSMLGVRVEASQTVPSCDARPSSTPLPRSVRQRCGASSQRLTCRTLSLHPPSSLIKRQAAASVPGPAKSNHIAEVQLGMLSSTEVRG